jgi:hypothetical protein
MSTKSLVALNGLLLLASLFVFIVTPNPAVASEVKFTPQVPLPGQQAVIDFTDVKDTRPIAEYIKLFFKYLTGVAGILATVFMMVGGVIWLTAAGSPDKISTAKSYVTSSITGLLLAFGAYILLATINTDLVNLRTTSIQQIAPPGCCEVPKAGGSCAYTTADQCKSGWRSDSDFVCSGDGKKCESGHENARKLLYDNPTSLKCVNEGGSPIVLTAGNDTSSAGRSCSQTCKGSYSGNSYTVGVTNFYCCKCFAADPTAVKNTTCSSGAITETEGKICEVSPGNGGYCRLGFCTPCKKSGEACDNSVLTNYQCCSGDCRIGFTNKCK